MRLPKSQKTICGNLRKSAVALLLVVCGPIAFAEEPPIRPGDHIAIVGNTFADQLRIHGYLETLLLQHSAENPISIRNLGWGGDTLTARDRPTNFPTEESTLTANKTDVIIACFGLSESFAGKAGLNDFKSDLKALIATHSGKKYNGESEVRLILVSPFTCEDLGNLTPEVKKRNRDLESYTRAMYEVAEESKLPFVNLYDATSYLMEERNAPKLTTNGIHLNAYGYWALSHSFFSQLTAGAHSPWLLNIDAGSNKNGAYGVELGTIKSNGDSLEFQVTEKSAPTLPPPIREKLPSPLAINRDRLTVTNLAPGDYTLSIDGRTLVTASHEEWARGVPVDSSPAHKAAEAYRAAVNDKNLQFTYGWKALNQVHIVGERRTSPSGKALPAELIEFNKLAAQRDEALRAGIELKTRNWKLTPAKH